MPCSIAHAHHTLSYAFFPVAIYNLLLPIIFRGLLDYRTMLDLASQDDLGLLVRLRPESPRVIVVNNRVEMAALSR
jgi:hypothetical protein